MTDIERRPPSASSWLRLSPEVKDEEMAVPATSLDAFFDTDIEGPVYLWVDVEGASKGVLDGASNVLERTDVLLIKVEEHHLWDGQWRSIDVLTHLVERGLAPISREVQLPGEQGSRVLEEEVELPGYLNCLRQRMGVPAEAHPGPASASTRFDRTAVGRSRWRRLARAVVPHRG